MKGRTRVNHPPDAPVPADNRPLVAPIHQTVKFAFESLDETMRAYRGEREGYCSPNCKDATTALQSAPVSPPSRAACFR
jgi:methionine-gamma-lyase